MSSISVLPFMTSPRTTKDLFEGLKQQLFVANAGRMFKKMEAFICKVLFLPSGLNKQGGIQPTML